MNEAARGRTRRGMAAALFRVSDYFVFNRREYCPLSRGTHYGQPTNFSKWDVPGSDLWEETGRTCGEESHLTKMTGERGTPALLDARRRGAQSRRDVLGPESLVWRIFVRNGKERSSSSLMVPMETYPVSSRDGSRALPADRIRSVSKASRAEGRSSGPSRGFD